MTRTMTQAFHKSWLKFTAVLIASFGPIFALGSIAATQEPARLSLDILSWPIDGATTYTSTDTHFLSAITGGFLFGWGVMIWCLAVWAHDLAPEAVRKSVLTGILAWFVLDSAGSIASGNASNASFNIIVLLLAVGPLWRPATWA